MEISDSTVARMAGNIASTMLTILGSFSEDDMHESMQSIAKDSVRLARMIVAEVQATRE